MSASMSHGANAEPNLTPMLDMVFQLVTFFMLVINFKGAAMDLSLKLPVVGSARPVDAKGKEELLVLNIDHEGQLKVYGESKPDVKGYIAEEARSYVAAAKQKDSKFQPGDSLPAIVVIRADQATPFELLNRVIKTCQDHGFQDFALKAMNRSK